MESSREETNETDSDEKTCALIAINPDTGLLNAEEHPANRCT